MRVGLVLLAILSLFAATARAEPVDPSSPASAPDAPSATDSEAVEDRGVEVTPVRLEDEPVPADKSEVPLDQHPCLGFKPEHEAVIDLTRRQLHQTLCGASLWFDGLFGEHDHVDAARSARGRLETSFTYSDFYGNKFRTRLDVRVDLPNLENRLSAFIGRDEENAYVQDRSEGFALRSQFPSINDDDEWLAGLGYSLPRNERFSSDFRVGVRSLRDPRLFVRTRLRYNLYADQNDLVHLRLTPFWNTRDQFGITPGVDYSRVLNPRRLFRFSNLGTITEKSRSFGWRSALIVYQALEEGRGVALESFIRGATRSEVSITEYGSRLIFRQPLFSQKLFLELVGGYTFPKQYRTESREGSSLLAIGLELPFGRKAELVEDITEASSSPGQAPDALAPESPVDDAPFLPTPEFSPPSEPVPAPSSERAAGPRPGPNPT